MVLSPAIEKTVVSFAVFALNTEIYKRPEDVHRFAMEITSLADRLRASLAFLPAGAYLEHIHKGQLWVAVDSKNQKLLGYLMFGGIFPHLKVFHIAIDPQNEIKYTGKLLIQSLTEYANEHSYLTISAKVAAELPANKFWEKMNFRVVRHLKGKGSLPRTINLRVFELESSSLFGNDQPDDLKYKNKPTLPNPLRVIDLNIFFDLVNKRVHQKDAQQLIGLALENRIRLAITEEFLTELKRFSKNFDDDPILDFAKTIPRISRPEQPQLQALVDNLRQLVFPNRSESGVKAPNNQSDLIHLATCIAHNAQSFVTRELAILKHSVALLKTYDIEILTATDLIESQLDPSHNNFLQTPRYFENRISVEPFTTSKKEASLKFLFLMQVEEDHAHMLIGSHTSSTNRTSIVASDNEGILGYLYYERNNNDSTCRSAAIVDEKRILSEQVFDHFLKLVDKIQPSMSWNQVHIQVAGSQLNSLETATAQGYRIVTNTEQSGGLVSIKKSVFCGPVIENNWHAFTKGFADATNYSLPSSTQPYEELVQSGILLKNATTNSTVSISLRDLESSTNSLLFVDKRPAALIPIRKAYAEDLLNYETAQQSLLSSPEASLRPERAYYLSPGRESIFLLGAIAFFYVSGTGGGPKEVVCMSRITSSKKMGIDEAISTTRFGVVDQTQLNKISNNDGNVVVVTFDQITHFPNPVSYKTLKDSNIIDGANLVTSQKISMNHAITIIEHGYNL